MDSQIHGFDSPNHGASLTHLGRFAILFAVESSHGQSVCDIARYGRRQPLAKARLGLGAPPHGGYMTHVLKNRLFLVSLLAVAMSGCIIVDDDPLEQGTLQGSWLINGQPANATSCAAAGIQSVRFTVNDGTATGPLYRSWDMACADGGFDSRTDTTKPRIPLNRMFFSNWRAVDMAGNEIGATDFLELELSNTTTHATLATPDFQTAPANATLDGTWLINGAAATAAACTEAGIATVRFTVNEGTATGPLYQAWDIPCSAGGFDSRTDSSAPTVPLNTMYFSNWSALDSAGTVIAQTDFLELEVAGTNIHATLASPDFIVDLTDELTVNFRWETALGSGTFTDCAGAGVSTMGYMLYPEGGSSMLAGETGVACADGLIFSEDDIPSFGPGSYDLVLNGTAGDGRKWSLTCEFDFGGGTRTLPGTCDIIIIP